MTGGAPAFIVVEGPIGVGKTSLASRLGDALGSSLLLEQPDENPFLGRFYTDPVQAALPTQLFFLFQRARQFNELRQQDLFQPRRVADFMIDKDPLFARITLQGEDLRIYEQVYAKVALDTPRPDLVVYLQAPPEVLMERVLRRARPVEEGITLDYLDRVAAAYTDFFRSYTAAPLLVVDAASINPLENDAELKALLECIHGARRGRHFFNLHPAGLEVPPTLEHVAR
jgi:deoxyadenosine/deoxycytidine kinase